MESKLKNIIEASDLSEEQKGKWHKVVPCLTQEDISNLVEVLELDKKYLYFLTENLENKEKLIKTQDEELANKVLDDEKKYLEEEVQE